MVDPATPNTAAAPSGTGESLTVAQAAERIEGLLGPAPADKPKPRAAAPNAEPAPEPEDAEADLEAAPQPAEGEVEADEQTPPDEGAEAEPGPTAKPPLEIEVALPDGSTAKVKADEWKNGYLRHSDYTRGKQALSQDRQAFQADVQNAQQAIKQRLDTLGAELDRLIPSEKSIDWDALHQKDPAEYVKWKEHFRDLKDRREAVAKEQGQIAWNQQQQAERQSTEALKRESEALAKAFPVFADPKKGESARAELRSYLLKAGYTPEQVGSLSDHRSVGIAWKAAQYDKLQGAKPAAEKRVVNLPRVQKPGAAAEGDAVSRQKVTSLTEKLRKTGRTEDAARLLLARMN